MHVRRVGEVAKATGLTVRALHHYDEIGLLVPSRRSGAGEQMRLADRLRSRLTHILDTLDRAVEPSGDLFIDAIDEGPERASQALSARRRWPTRSRR
jgi:DNA-binding transcriptional MerR regulator